MRIKVNAHVATATLERSTPRQPHGAQRRYGRRGCAGSFKLAAKEPVIKPDVVGCERDRTVKHFGDVADDVLERRSVGNIAGRDAVQRSLTHITAGVYKRYEFSRHLSAHIDYDRCDLNNAVGACRVQPGRRAVDQGNQSHDRASFTDCLGGPMGEALTVLANDY